MNGDFVYPHRVAEGRVSSSRDDNATSSTPPPLDDNRFTSSSTPVLTPGSRSRACYMEYNPVPAHHHHQQRQCQQPQHPAAPPYAAMHSICNAAAAAAAAANQIQQPQEFLFGSTTAAAHSYQIPTHHPFFAPANPDYYPTNGVVVGSGSSNGLQQMQEISSSSRPATSISSNHCSTNLMPLMSLQTAAGNTINQGGQYTLSSHLNRCNMLPTTGQFSSNHPNAHPNNPAANQMSSPNNNTNYQQQQQIHQQQQQQQFAAAYHNSFTPHFMAAAMDYSGSLRYAPNDMGMAAIPNAHHSQHQPNNPHHPFNYPPHHPHNLTPSNNNNQLLPPAPMPPPANFHAFYRPDQKIRETFLALTKIKQRNIPANPTQINNRLITNRAFRLPEKPETEFCKVCGAKSSGFHFGVFTCEACKGFFRRYSRKQRVITPCAVRCEITISNRNNCPACRFAKCKAVGMAIENIRYGKPPKCVKLPRSISSVIPRLEDPDVLNRLLDAYSSSQPINTPSKTLSFARCTASILKIPNFVDPPKMPSTAPNQPAQAVMPTNIHQILLAVLNDELPEPHRITDVFEKILMCLFAQYKESISTNDNCIGDKILQMSEQIFATDRKRKAKFMLTLVYVTSVYI